MPTIDMPTPFVGTNEEKEANWKTHRFDPQFDRCINCDCRPYGRIAMWPCGTSVPREIVSREDVESLPETKQYLGIFAPEGGE